MVERLAFTEKQQAKAAELSATVLNQRRELDAMQSEIEDLEEKLKMAREYRAKAVIEYQEQVSALTQLLAAE